MKRLIIAFLLLTQVACSSISLDSIAEGEHGRVLLYADEKGMQAFGDSLNSLITNGKASADTQDTPAYNLRREQVRASVLRYNAPRRVVGDK